MVFQRTHTRYCITTCFSSPPSAPLVGVGIKLAFELQMEKYLVNVHASVCKVISGRHCVAMEVCITMFPKDNTLRLSSKDTKADWCWAQEHWKCLTVVCSVQFRVQTVDSLRPSTPSSCITAPQWKIREERHVGLKQESKSETRGTLKATKFYSGDKLSWVCTVCTVFEWKN